MDNKKFLTRGEAVDVDDTELLMVEVPEWGGCVYLKGLTGEESVMYAEQTEKAAKKQEVWKEEMLWLLSRTILDGNKEPLFPGEQGIKDLAKKNGVVLGKLYNLALRLSILGDAELAELVKNLKAAQEDSSSACVCV